MPPKSKSSLSLNLRDFHACVDASSESVESLTRKTPAWSVKKKWMANGEDELESSFLGCMELYGESIVKVILEDCEGDKQAAVDLLNQQTDLAPRGEYHGRQYAFQVDDVSSLELDLKILTPSYADELCNDWIHVRRKRREKGESPHSCDSKKMKQDLELSRMYYNARRSYFRGAQSAWNNGDKRGAGELSTKGKFYARLAREHHLDYFEAELTTFARGGSSISTYSDLFTVDLHHLFEHEALALLEFLLTPLLDMDKATTIQVITGRGNRSTATNGRGVLLTTVCLFFDSLSFEYKVEGNGGSVNCILRL